jgi:hypothetical protein
MLLTRNKLHTRWQGEQQYCRKWHSDKTSKTVLGQNGENFFQKCGLGTKCRILVYIVSKCFFLSKTKKKVYVNDFLLNIIEII